MPLLLLLLQAAPAATFGVEFQPPPGWHAIEAPPVRAFAPPLGRGQVLLLTVWPAERLGASGDFATWFTRKLTIAGETVLQQSGPDRRSGSGVAALTATQRVTSARTGQMVRVVYAVNAGDRVALAMLSANQDELITRYAAPARAFFESMRFPDAAPPKETAPIPAAGFDADGPHGMFYRLRTGLGTAQMETRVLIFLEPRRLLRVHPFGDGNAIDLGRCSPNTCGTYRVEDGWLSVRWDDGSTQRLSLARAGSGLTLDGDAYQPARAVTPAEAVGDWVDAATAAGPFDAALRLRSDGSFEWGAGGTPQRGRYELQERTLVLHFTDGTNKGYALFAAGLTAPLGLISFDGRVYARR